MIEYQALMSNVPDSGDPQRGSYQRHRGQLY